ncbi:FliM/FliN family flagellar motor switch protein [Vibrio vulnificus]|nr:FliM/FliN family flagellar motor switch protein [Vibrio vulnificus]
MEKGKLRLEHDLITSFFTDALRTLLPAEMKEGSQCTVKKGESARIQRYALFDDGKDRKGIEVYFNKPFAEALMESYFPEVSLDLSDIEQPFIQHIVSGHIDAWLKEMSLLDVATSKQRVELCFKLDVYEVALSVPEGVLPVIYEHHLKLDTKSRISGEKAGRLFSNQPVDLDLTLPKITMSLDALVGLKPGDRIHSGRRVDAGLTLNIKDKTVVRNVFVSYKDEKARIVVGNI